MDVAEFRQPRTIRLIGLFLIVFACLASTSSISAQVGTGEVYVIAIDSSLDRGIAPYVERVIEDAEKRRAMAVAEEQEMRARVVEAEAEVPRAMAEAFRNGNLGIMDYYRVEHIQAETGIRESISGDDA